MEMGMGTDTTTAACKISMLWNWYTVDSCFIASSWHIRSPSMFAGSCIGVVLLVMSLELLRRLSKEYERHILRQFQRYIASLQQSESLDASTPILKGVTISSNTDDEMRGDQNSSQSKVFAANTLQVFRPNIFQQAIRATLHLLQFGIAYFVMLLAMYFNGYIIISILIGAWLGAFCFTWESTSLGETRDEVTICCG